MKKLISILIIISLLIIVTFSGCSFAVSLDAINVDINKTTVRPGENVTLTIEFGTDLGSYTFDIAYDDNIFEYVSTDGGTASDTTDKVRVVYYDSTGGSNPRTNMSIIFKAKEDITTSNPTELTVTGEGLANADASVNYDDITSPIVKNITVEPEYIDYTLKLDYTGKITKDEEKEMTLSYSSPMGRYYEHARLIAEATTPSGATVQLLGTDSGQLEHDIIQSGWGDAQGYKIGGKDVSQVLNVRALFSHEGEYSITLKLIDRDTSDSTIAEKTFSFNVLAEETTVPQQPVETPEQGVTEERPEKTPTELPKTGKNIYGVIMAIIIVLTSIYIYNRKRK